MDDNDNQLFETGILMRRNCDSIKRLNELWWKELDTGSVRDQLSFPYVLWKNPDVRINAIEETFVSHQSQLGRKQSEHFDSLLRVNNRLGDSK